MLRPIVAGFLGTLAFTSVASADQLLFQSIPDLLTDQINVPRCSSCAGQYRAFDQFMLSTSANVAGIEFVVQNDYFFPTDVTIGIFTVDANALPATELFSETFAPDDFVTTAPAGAPQHDNFSLITVAPAALSLAAGDYYISFYNPENLGLPTYDGGSGKLYEQGYTFFPGQSLAFRLLGDEPHSTAAVPEPATWVLMVAGFFALMFFSRGQAALFKNIGALSFAAGSRSRVH